ncbi:DUF6587 family protein [Pseudoxanthomonas mexicana]
MDLSLALQYAIIALLVVASVWVVLKKQFPGPLRKVRIAMALPLLREGNANWQRMLGRWIAPAGSSASDAACGGCSSCGPDKKN